MIWRVTLHPEVDNDLVLLGPAEARNILKVIRDRIEHGEPDKSGKALSGSLAGFRRIRTGSTDTPISFATKRALALSGGNNRATTLFLNASPYRAIFLPYRPQVQNHIGATTILTQGGLATLETGCPSAP